MWKNDGATRGQAEPIVVVSKLLDSRRMESGAVKSFSRSPVSFAWRLIMKCIGACENDSTARG
jgi:hypothetical protein